MRLSHGTGFRKDIQSIVFFVKDFWLEVMLVVDIKPVKEAKMTTMLEIMLKNASNGNKSRKYSSCVIIILLM